MEETKGVTDIIKTVGEETITSIEKHLFALLDVCNAYNLEIHISEGIAGIYSEEGNVLLRCCSNDSELANKALGKGK